MPILGREGDAMLDAFWSWLKDPANRDVIGWIGSGVVIVVGSVWAVVKFFAKPRGNGGRAPSVRANGGGVAIGGSNLNSPITTNLNREKPGRDRNKPKA